MSEKETTNNKECVTNNSGMKNYLPSTKKETICAAEGVILGSLVTLAISGIVSALKKDPNEGNGKKPSK